MTRRPTSRDIADKAGVSQATVSRALRNSPLVRPETRERVLEIARELNYRVDRSAAGLRTRTSRTIALLLFEDPTSDESHINPFFLAMLGSITRAAAAVDYDVLVSFQQLSKHWHARYEASNRADGLILLGYGDYSSYDKRLKSLADADAHFILWGPRVEDYAGHTLGCDNVRGADDAVSHLLALGRRRIAFLGRVDDDAPEFAERYAGYGRALQRANIDVDPRLRADAISQESAGRAGVRALFDSGVPFDAIFAASDLIAIGAMQALRQARMRIPQDVSVVGFDDIPSASYVNPPLTTIRQDTVRAGQLLVDNIIAIIEGKQVDSVLLPPRLVVRDSCGANTLRSVSA